MNAFNNTSTLGDFYDRFMLVTSCCISYTDMIVHQQTLEMTRHTLHDHIQLLKDRMFCFINYNLHKTFPISWRFCVLLSDILLN